MPSNSLALERSILVVSDDPTFVGKVLSLWGEPETSPNLTVVRSQACASQSAADFKFVLVGGVQPDTCRQIVDTFRAGPTPVIVVVNDRSLQAAEANSASVVVLREFPQWHDLLTVLATEVSRRSVSQAQVRRIERHNQELDCEAKLGRYVIDARHNLNNSLTSVLGNAELLLLEDGKWAATERKQIETIRIMALRLHETIRRFSSLEQELRAAGRESVFENEVQTSSQICKTNCSETAAKEFPRAYAQAAGAD